MVSSVWPSLACQSGWDRTPDIVSRLNSWREFNWTCFLSETEWPLTLCKFSHHSQQICRVKKEPKRVCLLHLLVLEFVFVRFCEIFFNHCSCFVYFFLFFPSICILPIEQLGPSKVFTGHLNPEILHKLYQKLDFCLVWCKEKKWFFSKWEIMFRMVKCDTLAFFFNSVICIYWKTHCQGIILM